MTENITDDTTLSRLNQGGDELTPEGEKVAMLLDEIAKNPQILDEKPELKEFYDLVMKTQKGEAKFEGDRIIIEDNLEKVNSKIQEEFGYDTFEDFMEASKTWKAGSDKFEQWNTLIQNAPQSLSTAISLYLQGNDNWSKAIALDTKIDFTQPKQSKKELIKFYFPNQFTEEELADLNNTEDEAIKRAIKISEGFYQREHEAFVQNFNRAKENQTRVIQDTQKALDRNKENLKKKYPSMTDAQVSKLITTLKSGAYARHFLTADNILSDTAAEKLIALEMPDFYAKTIIGKTREEQNREKQDLLTRSSDHPTLKGKVFNPEKKDINQVQKSLLTKRPTYSATPIKP